MSALISSSVLRPSCEVEVEDRNKGMGPKSMPSKSKLKFSSCDLTGIVPGLERPVAGENALKAADVAEDVEVKVTAAAVESRAADVAA
jgi:hypothetical protein